MATDYVRKRKEEASTGKIKENSSILNLFMENTTVFTEDIIVDELLGMVSGGFLTTQYAS